MSPRTREFFLFFLLPGVIVALAYTILTQVLPMQFNVWIGLLVSLTFSSTVKAWTEVRSLSDKVIALGSTITGTSKVFSSYSSLMIEAERLVLNPNNRPAIVFVYKGYTTSMEDEGRYFQATVKAIEEGIIGQYHRVMSVRNIEEAESVVEVLKIISKSEKARAKTKLYLSFRPSANYISFITVGEDECLFALPDLAAAPRSIPGHRSGIYVKDQRVVLSLKEVFHEIRRQDSDGPIDIPGPDVQDERWEELRASYVSRVAEVMTSPISQVSPGHS